MDGDVYRALNDPAVIAASTAFIGATAKRPDDAVPGIAWLSARSGYWPPPGRGEAPRDPPGRWESDAPRGVACLLLGVGAGGARWTMATIRAKSSHRGRRGPRVEVCPRRAASCET